MNPLESTLPTSDRLEQLIADCVRLIESQVARRGPMRRIAPGAALAVLEVIEPGALHRAVAHRLPDFAAALDRLNQQFLASKRPDFSQFLDRHPAEAVAAPIAVTDRRALGHVLSAHLAG